MARKMKPSGVDWAGDVPSNWNVSRLKNLTSIVGRGQSPNYSDDTSYMVVGQRCLAKYKLNMAKARACIAFEGSKGTFQNNDILFASTGDGTLGKCVIAPHAGSCDGHVTIIRFKDAMHGHLFWYWASVNFEYINTNWAKGATKQIELQRKELLAHHMLIPGGIELDKLLNYLDERTTTIDSKIQLLQEKVTALSDLRKSLIHQAVTKGLDLNVKMKPSGVDWIGDIPAHWDILRGKNILQYKKKLNHDRKHTRIWSLTLNGVRENNPDKPIGMVPSDYGTYQLFEQGDFVFKLIDLENYQTSRFGILPGPGIMSSAYMRMQVKKGMSDYLKWVFLDMWRLAVFNALGSNGVRSNLTYSDMYGMMYAFPTLLEQAAIAEYLNKRVVIIDDSIKTITEQITALKSLRQSLIHEAVTGKINVADFGYKTT